MHILLHMLEHMCLLEKGERGEAREAREVREVREVKKVKEVRRARSRREGEKRGIKNRSERRGKWK